MLQPIYVVKDLVSQTTNNPFSMTTDRDAIEGFREVCKDEKTQFHKFPEDYILYKIAEYDNESMLVKPMVPEQLARAIDLKNLE